VVTFEADSMLEEILSYAFSKCSALESIRFPRSVKTVIESAFFRCTSLTIVEFEAGSQLSVVQDYSFSSCPNLRTVRIPRNIQDFGPKAVSNCPLLSFDYLE
jgi:hypothetical protein